MCSLRIFCFLLTPGFTAISFGEITTYTACLSSPLVQRILMLLSHHFSLFFVNKKRGLFFCPQQQYRDVENSLMRSTIASVNTDHDDDGEPELFRSISLS